MEMWLLFCFSMLFLILFWVLDRLRMKSNKTYSLCVWRIISVEHLRRSLRLNFHGWRRSRNPLWQSWLMWVFACVWFIDSILNFCLKKRKRKNGFNKASNFGDIEEKKGFWSYPGVYLLILCIEFYMHVGFGYNVRVASHYLVHTLCWFLNPLFFSYGYYGS